MLEFNKNLRRRRNVESFFLWKKTHIMKTLQTIQQRCINLKQYIFDQNEKFKFCNIHTCCHHYHSHILLRLVTIFEEGVYLQTKQAYIKGNHGIQHGVCGVKQINPKMNLWRTSLDAGQRSFIGQQTRWNNSVRKL